MKLLFSKLNINDNFDSNSICDMNIVQEQFCILNTTQWKANVNSKPKLRTYMLSKNILIWKIIIDTTCTKDTDHSLHNFD